MSAPFSVVILAAGSGTRLGHTIPKQFVDVGGRRLVDFSLDLFVGWADQVIVTVPGRDVEGDVSVPEGVESVSGGQSRADSVANALALVAHDTVLIHDAARPFVTRDVVAGVLAGLETAACAYPVMPVPSTVVVDGDGRLASTPERERLREVQTPQGFRTAALRDAWPTHGDVHAHLPELIRASGGEVRHTTGSPWLFKVTYEPSLHVARYYAEHGFPQEGER